MVFHTLPNSKKEATERLTILMRGCTRPQSGPASNRQNTRHSRLQTMLDAEQPDKLLAHLSRRISLCARRGDASLPLRGVATLGFHTDGRNLNVGRGPPLAIQTPAGLRSALQVVAHPSKCLKYRDDAQPDSWVECSPFQLLTLGT